MKINTKTLINFLSTVRMNEIEIIGLNFLDNGLNIHSDSNANTHQVKALLKKEAFIEYEPVGEIGVDDLSRLISVMKSIGQEVKIKVDGNVLELSNKKKKVEVELVSNKFVPKAQEAPDIEFESSATLQASDIKEILNDIKSSKNSVVKINTVEEGLEIKTSGKFSYTYRYDSKDTLGGVEVSFGNPLINALSEISKGNITLHLKTQAPLLVENNDEKANYKFFIAPRTEE